MSEKSPYTGNEIVESYDYEIKLHDADGDDIGNVVEVNPEFIVAQTTTGFLGLGEAKLYFIPRDQVQREDEDDWYLGVDKDELESMQWAAAPSGSRYADEWAGGQQTEIERSDRTRLRRYEEDVDVQKVSREAGEVVVNKRVVEEIKKIEVPVRREEVEIVRRPVTDSSSTEGSIAGDQAFSGESITVPVMAEEVEVRKVVRPVEEIELTKTATEDTERVEETVRREEFDIDDQTKNSR